MTTVLLVADRHAGEPVVGPDVAQRLANLGISRITLLRDLSSTGVILEGWAFDPARAYEATEAVFPAGGASLRTYHEVQHMGVPTAHRKGNAQRHALPGDTGPSS